jgi:hypothetical protein
METARNARKAATYHHVPYHRQEPQFTAAEFRPLQFVYPFQGTMFQKSPLIVMSDSTPQDAW